MAIQNSTFLRNILDGYDQALEEFEVVLPSIDHCIGTKRLLGENYGTTLCSLFNFKSDRIITQVTELCILLRSYIVLDDFKRDTPTLKITALDYINNGLRKIKRRVLYLLKSLNANDENLWYYHLKRIRKAYSSFNSKNPFDSVLNKCSFVFLPFELSIFSKSSTLKSDLIIFVKYFLFSLQLIDDFHDMEEDLISGYNHNLYISGKSEISSFILIRGRGLILSSVLPYIRDNLSDVYSPAFNNSLIENYYYNSMSWISDNIRKLNNSLPFDLFRGRYEDFNLDENDVIKFEREFLNSKPIQLSEIRAEIMHSL